MSKFHTSSGWHQAKTTVTVDNSEAELQFTAEDYGPELLHQDGNWLVVGYISHDDDPSFNPLTDSDCQGNLYHSDRGYQHYDPSEILSHLRIVDSDGVPEEDVLVTIDNHTDTLIGHVKYMIMASYQDDVGQVADWFENQQFEDAQLAGWARPDGTVDYAAVLTDCGQDIVNEIDNWVYSGIFYEKVPEMLKALYKANWKQIVSPFVVPVEYSAYQETRVYVTTWDGDTDELPNAIWVADTGAEENITCGEILGDSDLREKAEAYAKSVLDEYEKWCNGDVYGVCTEVFARPDEDSDYELISDESCWGFIGQEYAEEECERMFKGEVDSLLATQQKHHGNEHQIELPLA